MSSLLSRQICIIKVTFYRGNSLANVYVYDRWIFLSASLSYVADEIKKTNCKFTRHPSRHKHFLCAPNMAKVSKDTNIPKNGDISGIREDVLKYTDDELFEDMGDLFDWCIFFQLNYELRNVGKKMIEQFKCYNS